MKDYLRRDWLKLTAAGVATGSASSWLSAMARSAQAEPGRRSKSCILLWMEGGPSQQHTFDLKQGGDYRPIATSVPGINISEHLPRLAQRMDELALLRSMSTGETVHTRARALLHSGYNQVGSEAFPALGCVAAAELGLDNAELPNFICINAGTDGNNGPGAYRPVPGYLRPQYAPLMIDNPSEGIANLDAQRGNAEFEHRAALLQASERNFLEQYQSSAADAILAGRTQAIRLMRSSRARAALNLQQEPRVVHDAYGDSRFGRACLLARRLVETGVPFVEVTLRGWDDHSGAAEHVRRRSPYMDQAMSKLLDDLKERGLLANTLVVWMGEFGRTPRDARNHFARAWSTLLAGAGLRTGQVVGRTDATGADVAERPISVIDFMATVCQALGINYRKDYETAGGRPVRIVERGANPIRELF